MSCLQIDESSPGLVSHVQSQRLEAGRIIENFFEDECIEQRVFTWRHAVCKRHELLLLSFGFVGLQDEGEHCFNDVVG